VDGEAAPSYQLHDLSKPGLPAIDPLGRDARFQVACNDAEEDCLENQPVVGVEGTVDEDAMFEIRRRDDCLTLWGMRVMPIRIAISDPSVAPVDVELGSLIFRNLSSAIDRFALRIEGLRRTG
jgi:hypothetical protein